MKALEEANDLLLHMYRNPPEDPEDEMLRE
jgi:hypothetical protein